MDFFFIQYRDPIFGIIIIFAILLIVAISTYIFGILNVKNNNQNIEKFIKKFETNELSDKHTQMLLNLDIDTDTFNALASTFSKGGDFKVAIGIYLVALKKTSNKKEREFLLTNLGKTYTKAGFYKRACDAFLEAISLHARNDEALRHLSMVYEKLKMYDKCLQTLNVLNEQGKADNAQIAYIKALIILNQTQNFDEKIAALEALYDDFNIVSRIILEEFINNQKPVKNIKYFPKISQCIDLLYLLKEPVNTSEFGEFFSAIGLIKDDAKIQNINLAIYQAAKQKNLPVVLNFSYFCAECKNNYPIFFYRCPNCAKLGSIQILTHIAKEESQESEEGPTF